MQKDKCSGQGLITFSIEFHGLHSEEIKAEPLQEQLEDALI